MADLSDVLSVLAATSAAALYPNGTGQASAVGVACKVYPGWPNAQQLDADLRAATPVCHVSIYAGETERNTTRYSPNDWKQASLNTAMLTLTAAGQTVTVGGTIPAAGNPHNLVILANGKSYVYRALVTDTVTSIAVRCGIVGSSCWPSRLYAMPPHTSTPISASQLTSRCSTQN